MEGCQHRLFELRACIPHHVLRSSNMASSSARVRVLNESSHAIHAMTLNLVMQPQDRANHSL